MKEKILASIKAKFPAVNLSKKRLDEIAAKIESKVTEESQIDAQIDVFNDFNPIEAIAKNDDLVADLKGKLKKPATPTTDKTETDAAADTAKTDDKPDPVLAVLNELKQELAAIKGEKIAETYTNKAKADLKDVPAAIWRGRPIPQDEEKYQAFVAEVKADHAELIQQGNNQGFTLMGTPNTSQGGAATDGKIDAGLKKFLEKQNEEAKALEASKAKSGFIQ